MGGYPLFDENHQFNWNEQRSEAAVLVARGKQSWEKIGQHLGINRDTIYLWYKIPEFRAKVDEHKATFAAEVLAHALADKTGRVQGYFDLKSRVQRIIDEREAKHDGTHKEPGMGTGLLAETKTVSIDSDDKTSVKTEYKYESAIVRDLTMLDTQIAKELGQWSEKGELTIEGPPTRVFNVTLDTDTTPFDMDEIDDIVAEDDEDDEDDDRG